MSVESFIRAMPKVELHIHLEGAMPKEELVLIAEQNDIPENLKHYNQWVALLGRPDYKRLDELIRITGQWIQFPEDLTRLVYAMGVQLSKQNIQYAEVSVNPLLYTDNGMTFEQFLAAINDGRDRVERGWGVKLAWILMIPRDQQRRADDYVRWASSAAAKKGGVVGIGLGLNEAEFPASGFERTFKTAEKKAIPRLVHAGENRGAEAVLDAIHNLLPNRIYQAWGAVNAPDVLSLLVDQNIAVNVGMAWDVGMGRAATYADYPLRQLYESGVTVTIGADMPELFNTTLNDQYLMAVEHCGLSLEALEDIALNAVRVSLLPDKEKQDLLEKFTETYARLRAEHIAPQMT